MYRCRRLIAIVLSLAVVASTFIFFASAEDSEYNQIVININGSNYNLAEGEGISFQLQPDASFTVNINSIRARSGSLLSNESLAVNFTMRFLVFYSSLNFNARISNLNPYPSNVTNYSVSGTGYLQTTWFQDMDNYFEPDRSNLAKLGYDASFLLTNTNIIDLGVSGTWKNNSLATITVAFVFQNVSVTSSTNWFNHTILVPQLYAISNALALQNTKLFSDQFSYNEISYDSDGNSSITEKSGNWITAMLGTLKSILAPVEKQVEEEQMAKDAGFNDVLGDAYSSSSPGSLIDILDIGDLATWDETSWEDSMGDSFLYWFSQSCADDIDTVPATRGEEPQIIDFYSQHINDYWEALGIGTADQGGD